MLSSVISWLLLPPNSFTKTRHKFSKTFQFELAELNTPVGGTIIHARFTVGGAAATHRIFSLDGERSV